MSSGAGEALNNETSPIQRVAFLDDIRGFAILAVFMFHALRAAYDQADLIPWAGWFRDPRLVEPYKLLLVPFNSGSCGVAIFFVVSGFCIHISHSRNQERDPWLKGFFIRRIFRIYPPYLCALLLFSFVYPWRRIEFGSSNDTQNFVSHALLVHNLGDLSIFAGINPSFWSIAVEFQLYLIYPLLFWLAGRSGWQRALIWSGAIEVGMRLIVSSFDLPRGISYSPFSFALSWGIGAGIADAYIKGKELPLVKHNWIIWAAVAVASAYIWPLTRLEFLLFAIATATFVSRSLNGERLLPAIPGRELLSRHLHFVGAISYSLYLIHQPLLATVKPILRRLLPDTEIHPVLVFVLCLATWPGVLLLAWIMYRWLEVPPQKWGRAMAKKLTASTIRQP